MWLFWSYATSTRQFGIPLESGCSCSCSCSSCFYLKSITVNLLDSLFRHFTRNLDNSSPPLDLLGLLLDTAFIPIPSNYFRWNEIALKLKLDDRTLEQPPIQHLFLLHTQVPYPSTFVATIGTTAKHAFATLSAFLSDPTIPLDHSLLPFPSLNNNLVEMSSNEEESFTISQISLQEDKS